MKKKYIHYICFIIIMLLFSSFMFAAIEKKNHGFDKVKKTKFMTLINSDNVESNRNGLKIIYDEIKAAWLKPDEARKLGELTIDDDVLDAIKKFSKSKDADLQVLTFQILSCEKESNRLKSVIGDYLYCQNKLYKKYAVQFIRDKNLRDGKFVDELLNIAENDTDSETRTEARLTLLNYNESKIFEKMKKYYINLSKPYNLLNNALKDKDVQSLVSVINSKFGFWLRLGSQNSYFFKKIITANEAKSLFEGDFDQVAVASCFNLNTINTFSIITDNYVTDTNGSPYDSADEKAIKDESAMTDKDFMLKYSRPVKLKAKQIFAFPVKITRKDIKDSCGYSLLNFQFIIDSDVWYLIGLEALQE